jgi:hypothetical protein
LIPYTVRRSDCWNWSHAVGPQREVGAVIEVVSAQEILIRLAVAAVLRDDHPGDQLHQLARAQQGAGFDAFIGYRTFAGGIRSADAGLVVSDDFRRGRGHLLLRGSKKRRYG